MYEPDLNLRAVLFSADAARRHIALLRAALEHMVRTIETSKEIVHMPELVYGRCVATAAAAPPPAVPMAHLMREIERPDRTSLRSLLAAVDAGLATAAASESELVHTWVMVLFMYVSRHFRDIICTNTEPALAQGYLAQFETRVTTAVCGHVVPKKPRKRKSDASGDKIIQACDTPVDIAVAERTLFRRLQKSRA
jgi:hypothetical protein